MGKIKWIHLLTLKEKFQLIFYKIGSLIIKVSNYHNDCENVISDMVLLIMKGYNVSRKGKLILVHFFEEGNSNFSCLLRPGTSDVKVFNQVIIESEYQPLIDMIQKYKGQITIKKIIDAGSNIGLTSLFFKRYFPDCQIVSIEPDELNYIYQKKNFKINKFENDIILKKALWINKSDQLIISNEFRDGQSWAKSITYSNEKNEKFVSLIELDDILPMFKTKDQYIDILKIDIEGSEGKLFQDKSFLNVLKESVRFLCLEIHDEVVSRERVYSILEEINFSYFEKGETCFAENKNFDCWI